MKTIYTRNCAECAMRFDTLDVDALFCSRECFFKAKNESYMARRQRRIEKHKPILRGDRRKRKGGYSRECILCGTPFYAVTLIPTKYCSARCSHWVTKNKLTALTNTADGIDVLRKAYAAQQRSNNMRKVNTILKKRHAGQRLDFESVRILRRSLQKPKAS